METEVKGQRTDVGSQRRRGGGGGGAGAHPHPIHPTQRDEERAGSWRRRSKVREQMLEVREKGAGMRELLHLNLTLSQRERRTGGSDKPSLTVGLLPRRPSASTRG